MCLTAKGLNDFIRSMGIGLVGLCHLDLCGSALNKVSYFLTSQIS